MIDHIAEALDAEQPITENDIVVTSEQLNQLAKESTHPSKAPETEDSIDGDREFRALEAELRLCLVRIREQHWSLYA